MSQSNPGESDPATRGHITSVSPDVINAFRSEPHDIDSLFNKLKRTNPELAGFILARVEQLAPGDMNQKETLARVALETLGVIEAQGEATDLDELFKVDIPEPERPLAS